MKTQDSQLLKSTFAVAFIIQKGKCRADGTAPIFARISLNTEKVHIATRQYVDPTHWNVIQGRTLGATREEKQINEIIEELKAAIKTRYNELIFRGETISASKLKRSIMSLDERSMSLMELFEKFITDYEKLTLTQDYGQESFFRYKICHKRVAEYLQKQYKVSDYPLTDINRKFLDNLYLWLRTEHKLNNNTTVKFMHRFSSVFKMARDNGWVSGDPFKLQKLHLDKVDRGYLTEDEIRKMYDKEFDTERLETVRDIFIFSCYTGLAYIDVKGLTQDMLKVWPDGNVWISCKRQKTKVPVNVRLLDVPLQIIEKYKDRVKGNKVLPVPTNQKCNDYLKEIAEVCGIHKELCYHMARHTFATTVTLSNGVPIESVSKMLGHTNIRTTQIYARITDQKVNKDMEVLSEKLNGIFSHPTEPSKQSKHEAARIADLPALVRETRLSI